MPKTKIDKGRAAYEASLAEHPTYIGTKNARPSWDELPESAQLVWRERANAGK